jgi:hypothetical protein
MQIDGGRFRVKRFAGVNNYVSAGALPAATSRPADVAKLLYRKEKSPIVNVLYCLSPVGHLPVGRRRLSRQELFAINLYVTLFFNPPR